MKKYLIIAMCGFTHIQSNAQSESYVPPSASAGKVEPSYSSNFRDRVTPVNYGTSLKRNYFINAGKITNGNTYSFDVILQNEDKSPVEIPVNQSNISGYSLPASGRILNVTYEENNSFQIKVKSDSGVGKFSDLITVSTKLGPIFISVEGDRSDKQSNAK